MLPKRIKVDTVNLELGMYVAQLDRPWLETPFIMQGFEIRGDDELGLLRKFCKHVYVDVERSSVPRERVLEAHNSMGRNHDPFANLGPLAVHAPRPSSAQRLLRALGRMDPTGGIARLIAGARQRSHPVATREEAPRAAHAYGLAVDSMNEVVEAVRKGPTVDVEKVKAAVTPLVDSVLRNEDALAWLVCLRKRDEYDHNHSIACAVWATLLGRHLGFDRSGLQTLAMGGVLLDIGKVRLPASIASKAGPLGEDERQIMQMHVDYSVDIARKSPGINDQILQMIACHHERHDGSGYPRGLAGSAIPAFGRISGLVDCYDAMITERPYAPARSSYAAVRELNLLAGKQFQPELVETFVKALGMFPTGSIVELNTGEVGIVVGQNDERRLRPRLLLLLDRQQRPLGEPRALDLARVAGNPGDRGARWIVQGHEAGAFDIDPGDYYY